MDTALDPRSTFIKGKVKKNVQKQFVQKMTVLEYSVTKLFEPWSPLRGLKTLLDDYIMKWS